MDAGMVPVVMAPACGGLSRNRALVTAMPALPCTLPA